MRPAGANVWELTFDDEVSRALARRLAEHIYGDAGRALRLELHALPAGEAGTAFELVATPPCRQPLVVAVTFPVAAARGEGTCVEAGERPAGGGGGVATVARRGRFP
jgi:hypothetical protein